MPVNQFSRQAREKRTPIIPLDLRARSFDELAVFHSSGTRAFAGTAIEASIDVEHEGVAQLEAPFVHQDHLPNPPARGIGFQSPQAIGGAVVQTEAAVNAVKIIDILRAVWTTKSTTGVPRRIKFVRHRSG